MASNCFKNSLKRQRCDDGGCDNGDEDDDEDDVASSTITHQQTGGRQSSDQMPLLFLWIEGNLQGSSTTYPSHPCHTVFWGRKQSFSFHAFLGSFIVLFLSQYVLGETQLRHYFHGNDSFDKTRSISYQSWEGKGQQGNHEFLNYARGKDSGFVENIMQQHEIGVIEKERVLQSGERLEKIIRQQDKEETKESLPPALRNDIDEKSLSGSQLPNEIDVPTAPSPLEYGEYFKKGNPLIQNRVSIDFTVKLLVENATTNKLLKEVEVFLENYIENEYKKLINGGGNENRNTDGVSNSDLETLRLREVDLTLQLLESRWWQERQRRRLNSKEASSIGGSLRSEQRNMQEGMQSSNAKLITISVNGAVNYSMEVDGSLPTPDDIEEQWNEAYHEIISQNQLQRAIEDTGIEGVLRIEEVDTTQDPSDKSNNEISEVDGVTSSIEDYDNNGGTTDGITSLYNNDTKDGSDELPAESTEGDDDKKNSGKKSSQLERPSTLSIVFGFILTGIAVLGLVGYAYIFYRKRQKRLKKKKKMKESITFSSANAAAAAAASAAAASNIAKNTSSQYPSKARPQSRPQSRLSSRPSSRAQSASRPLPPIQQSPIQMHPMMLFQSESEETSYKGLESSIGSEDISDSFANELKLAASRDQEAWDDLQRKKDGFEKRRVAPLDPITQALSQSRKSSARTSVPSLLSKRPKRTKGVELEPAGIETDLSGTPSFTKSFPYGDEPPGVRGEGDDEYDKRPYSAPWEPYNSSLSLVEEKKDETNVNTFFAQKLNDIEKDLAVSRGQSAVPPHNRSIETKDSDDNGTNSDIVSEVSELSKYVRRYEKRKDRKSKREESLHERLSVGERAPSHLLPSNTMSIGMDGRVYNPHSSNTSSRPTPAATRGLQPAPLASYKESYKGFQKHGLSTHESSLSFVSDDEDENEPEDGSIRSQRLGISPYRVSFEELYPRNNEDISSSGRRTPTTSSRTRSDRAQDDYRYSVGYGQDNSKSSSYRLAHLRANDAIIDNSNSEANLNIDATVPNGMISDDSKRPWSAVNKGNGMARMNIRRSNKDKNTPAVVSAATPRQQSNEPGDAKNKSFDKLRGIFEQKATDRPEPIYPPGEHWQYAGGKQSKSNF